MSLRVRLQQFLAAIPPTFRVASAQDPVMRELQTLHNRTVWRAHPAWLRLPALLGARVLWPAVALWQTRQLARRLRPAGFAACGFPGPHPDRQVLRFSLQHRLPPGEVVYHCLGRPERGPPGDFLPNGRAQLLLRTLNRGRDTSVLDDKLRFAAFCTAHALATPPLLAHIGATTEASTPSTAPHTAIFAKPRRGSGARGVQRWTPTATDSAWRRHDGLVARNWAAVLTTLRADAVASRDDLIVQPCLTDHPALHDLGNGALSTVRLLTARTPAGDFAPVAAMFNLPTGAALTNNLRDGALACPIDLADGTLRNAFTGGPGKPRFTHDPHRGAPLAGRTLPRWSELLALALRAHRQDELAPLPLIGWDLALTAEGPVLLEGNHQASLDFHQVAPNPPLAATPLPAWLLWHLRAATAANAP